MGKVMVQGMVKAREQRPLTVLLVILIVVLAVSPALEAKLFPPHRRPVGVLGMKGIDSWDIDGLEVRPDP